MEGTAVYQKILRQACDFLIICVIALKLLCIVFLADSIADFSPLLFTFSILYYLCILALLFIGGAFKNALKWFIIVFSLETALCCATLICTHGLNLTVWPLVAASLLVISSHYALDLFVEGLPSWTVGIWLALIYVLFIAVHLIGKRWFLKKRASHKCGHQTK